MVVVWLVIVVGDYLSVDDECDLELMWGLWGGGGNFGIVIEFEFVIYLFGLVVVVGFVVYWLDDGFVVFCGYW